VIPMPGSLAIANNTRKSRNPAEPEIEGGVNARLFLTLALCRD